MNSSDSTVRPSKIAAFLVELFAAPHEADGILGDLEEEFRTQIARDGEAAARRRYRRQAWRTMLDLAIAPPWNPRTPSASLISASGVMLSLGIGVVGLAMPWPLGWAIDAAARGLVVSYPVYQYVPAAAFWNATFALGPLADGIVVALLARLGRFRPMSVAVSVVAVMAIVMALDVPIMMALFGPPRGAQITFTYILVRWIRGVSVYGGLVLVGAAIGRKVPLPRRELRPA